MGRLFELHFFIFRFQTLDFRFDLKSNFVELTLRNYYLRSKA